MRSLIQFRVTSFALAFAFANVCLTGCAVETSTSEPAETTRTAQQAYGRPLELPILEGWDVDNLADRYPQDHSSAVNSGLSGAACLINCNTQAINCTKACKSKEIDDCELECAQRRQECMATCAEP